MRQSLSEIIQFPDKLQFLFQPARYKVAWGGRGAAKSWGFARALLLLGVQKSLRVLCVRELQSSIEDSVYKLLKDQIVALGLSGQYDVLKTQIRGPGGTEFNFEGIRHNADKIKSYEGIDICWVEEAHKVTKSSWEILVPTIRKNDSEIWVSFNPELETDETYIRFVKNTPTNSVIIKMSWRDNPWFPEVLMQEMLDCKARDYDTYLHVWEGHCKSMLEGAVYAEQLRDAKAEDRITKVPWERMVAVDTFWDLGRSDMTSIWFAQVVGFEYRVLDFYENRLKELEHYVQVCQARGYTFGTCWLPHDAKAKRLGTKRSIEEQLRGKLGHTKIVPNLSIADGIAAARTIFPNCWIDQEKCSDGLQALSHYRYKIIEEDDTLSKVPVHDWTSHAADAFRYMGIALKSPHKSQVGEKLLQAAKQVLHLDRTPDYNPTGWMQ